MVRHACSMNFLQDFLAGPLGDYNGRIRQAEEFGDLGLKVALENQIADETRHKEELERIIAGWDDR
jgi:hypothetical protein